VLGLVAESLLVIRDGDDIPEAIFKVGLMLPDIDDNMFQIRMIKSQQKNESLNSLFRSAPCDGAERLTMMGTPLEHCNFFPIYSFTVPLRSDDWFST
jgi:hypothetical protein